MLLAVFTLPHELLHVAALLVCGYRPTYVKVDRVGLPNMPLQVAIFVYLLPSISFATLATLSLPYLNAWPMLLCFGYSMGQVYASVLDYAAVLTALGTAARSRWPGGQKQQPPSL